MPVQINEMVIRANIVEPGQQGGGSAPPAGNAGSGGALSKDEIVKECAALVMEIINNKNKR